MWKLTTLHKPVAELKSGDVQYRNKWVDAVVLFWKRRLISDGITALTLYRYLLGVGKNRLLQQRRTNLAESLKVVQGRFDFHWWVVCVCVCVCDLLLTINCVHKYKSVLYHKWHFQRQILARSWIVGYSLFKVIGNGTIRYIAYEFLFVCNSGLDKYLHQILWEMHHGHAEMNAWPKVELEVNLRDVIKWTSEA